MGDCAVTSTKESCRCEESGARCRYFGDGFPPVMRRWREEDDEVAAGCEIRCFGG